MSGLFIVLEGIDGAGTTSQSKGLVKRLEEEGISAHLTREPTTGPIGKLLREILEGKHQPTDATTLGLLFAADRADHLQREIEPALAAGKVVISDRYYHSSLAYQGSEEERDWIAQLNARARKPDITYFLAVDPEVAASRREADNRDDELFDAMEVQRRVAQGYDTAIKFLSKGENILCIDGHQSMEDIAAALWSDCQNRLKEKHENN